MNNLGYTKPLFILAFDHRASISRRVFGKEIEDINQEEQNKLKEFKQIIYEGFKKASLEMPKEEAAILVDEAFGEEILINAKENNFLFAIPVEKSGQKEFDFEYEDYKEHIEKFKPNFLKVLLRYNPDQEREFKKRQWEKLKKISDFAKEKDYKFIIEVLMPPREEQIRKLGGLEYFEKMLRAKLAAEVIEEFQAVGVEPDIWKLEGMREESDYEKVVAAARQNSRDNVSIVILGRGEKKEDVEKWLSFGAKVQGIIGFAIGRTIFLEPINEYYCKTIKREEAVEKIADNYLYFYQFFKNFR